MNRHAPANEIMIGEFRQILAWPFVMPANWGKGARGSESCWFKKCIKALERQDNHWVKKCARELMDDGNIGAYEEVNDFHDYINDTLFRENPAIRTFQSKSLREMTFYFHRNQEGKTKSYEFDIPYNSLRIYDCGVAILTLELKCTEPRLTLSDAQFLIHSLRRVNPPSWLGPDAPANCPQRVDIHMKQGGTDGEKHESESLKSKGKVKSEADRATLTSWPCSIIAGLRRIAPWIRGSSHDSFGTQGKSKKIECKLGDLQNRDSALRALGDVDYRIPLFDWWLKILAPLPVEGNLEHDGARMCKFAKFAKFQFFCCLVSSRMRLRGKRKSRKDRCPRGPIIRQIMDARIPVLTTISLKGEARTAEVLHSISDSDWFRIAEAVEKSASGRDDGEFANKKHWKYIYDRFMPPVAEKSGKESPEVGARFVFAPHHFAAVHYGDSAELNFPELVRRQYRHMQHLCLLEFAAVVGISQRLYWAVNRRNISKIGGCDRKFRCKILYLQEMFMDFTHRYHFTGVSNELHIGELFARFRSSMKLDGMYKETKDELDSASNLAFAQRQMRVAIWAAILTMIAALIALIGLPLGFYQAYCMDCEQNLPTVIQSIKAVFAKMNWN